MRKLPRLGPTDSKATHGSKNCLGWIISGPASMTPYDTDMTHVSLCITECNTNILLCKFWEYEEIPQKLPLKEEKKQCERHFVSTHSRTAEIHGTTAFQDRFTHRYWRFIIDRYHSTCSNREWTAISARDSQTI